MTRKFEIIIRLLIFGWTLICAASVSAQAKDVSTKDFPGVVTVAVVPFRIEPQPFVGAPVRPDAPQFLSHLSDEATNQAQHTLVERHIADAAERLISRELARSRIVVTGTVRMPISLPPNLIGWNGAHHHGTFATAIVTATDAAGTILSRQEVSVNWNDVWWFRGGKAAFVYPLDQVLSSLARKAVDHGVRHLDLRSQAKPPQKAEAGYSAFRLAGRERFVSDESLPPALQTFSTPFEQMGKSHVPFVRLSLDDGKSYLFAVDPGTAYTSIDQNTAEAIGLPTKAQALSSGTAVNILTSNALLGSSKLKLGQVPFVVSDLHVYRSVFPGFAGILGANILTRFVVRVDFTKKQIDFTPLGSEDSAPSFSRAAKPVPLISSNGRYEITALVDGKTAKFTLSTLYDSTVLHSASLLSRLKPMATLTGLPSGEGTPVKFLRLQAVSVGEANWRHPVLEEPLTKEMIDTNILGLDFLHRYFLIMDLGHAKVYLDPDPAFRENSSEWLGLGFVPAPTDGGKLVVTAVGFPSPAQRAGLLVGDEITELQNLPVSTLTLQQCAAAVHGPVGKMIEITVQHRGSRIPRKIHLKISALL